MKYKQQNMRGLAQKILVINIKRILDELEAESFIRNPKEITKDGAYMYGYEKTPWRDIKK